MSSRSTSSNQSRRGSKLPFYCQYENCAHVTTGGEFCRVHHFIKKNKLRVMNAKRGGGGGTLTLDEGVVKDYLSTCDGPYINSGEKGYAYPVGPVTYHWMRLDVVFAGAEKDDGEVTITEMSDKDIIKCDRSRFSRGAFVCLGEASYAVLIKKAASSMLTSENGQRLTAVQEDAQLSCLDFGQRFVLEAVKSLNSTHQSRSGLGNCIPVHVRHFWREATRLGKNICAGKQYRAESTKYIDEILAACRKGGISVESVCNALTDCDARLESQNVAHLKSMRCELLALTQEQVSMPIGVAGMIYQNHALFGVVERDEFLRVCRGIQGDAHNLKKGAASSRRLLKIKEVQSAISKSMAKFCNVLPNWRDDQKRIYALLKHSSAPLMMKSLAAFDESLRRLSVDDDERSENRKAEFERIRPCNYYAWLVCTYMSCDVHWESQKESLGGLFGATERARKKDAAKWTKDTKEWGFACEATCNMHADIIADVDLVHKKCDNASSDDALLRMKPLSGDHVKMCKLLIKLHGSMVSCAVISKYDSVCGIKAGAGADMTMDRLASALTYATANSTASKTLKKMTKDAERGDVCFEIGDMNFLSLEVMSKVDKAVGTPVKSRYASSSGKISAINTEKFASDLFHSANVAYLRGSSMVVPRALIDQQWLGVSTKCYKFLQESQKIQCIAINPASLIGTFLLHSERDVSAFEATAARGTSKDEKLARFFTRVQHYRIK